MRRPLLALSLALALATLVAPAPRADDEVQIDATLDTQSPVEGESFNLTITITGPMRGSEAPLLPEMADFALAGSSSSSSFSFVNGQTSSSKIYRYTLVPLKSGQLQIPAIPVRVKGKVYQTRRLDLQVAPAGSGAPAPGAPPAGQPSAPPARRGGREDAGAGNRDVFVRSWLDRERVYVGQQLTHHFALFRKPTVSFLGTPQYAPPEFTGFWTEPLGDEISGFRSVDGVNYAATELRMALFPSEPGTLKVGAAGVQVRLRDRSRWDLFAFDAGPEKLLRTPELAVEVLPLPSAGRPANFQGTVAEQLSLDLRVDPGPYAAGQPLTVTIALSGLGNPRAFAEPSYEPGPAFKAYDAELDSKTKVDGERIRVDKRFTRVIVPREEGRFTLPAIEYAWFDPTQGRYRTETTQPITLQVAPGTGQETAPVVFGDLRPDRVELLGKDVHHIKTQPLLAEDGKRFPRSPAFWIFLALPWPLVAGTWVWRRRREAELADAAGTRARGALKVAATRLRAAQQARAAGDYDGFCTALAVGLRGYLADRLKLSAAGLTGDAAESGLRAAGAAEESCALTRGLLEDCDYARFAPGVAEKQGERMDALIERARALIVRLDGETGAPRRGRRLPFGLGLIALAALLAATGLAPRALAADSLEQRMADAAARYEADDFAGATGIWESLAREGLEDSHLWYNLGNAYYQQGDLGRAILSYRRAERLAPRDAQLRDNLALARARRADGDQVAAGGSAAPRAWRGLRSRVSSGEFAVAGLVLLWLTAALAVLGLLRVLAWRRLRWPLVGLGVLLPLVSIAAWTAEWQDWNGREAVLLAPQVGVTSGPGADFLTLFQIHAGAELRVEEERGDWLRVSLGEQLEGWIPRGSCQTL